MLGAGNFFILSPLFPHHFPSLETVFHVEITVFPYPMTEYHSLGRLERIELYAESLWVIALRSPLGSPLGRSVEV